MSQNLATRFAGETVLFGGFPMRRVDVHAMMLADGHPAHQADRFAFRPPAIDAAPFDLSDVRAMIGEAHGGRA